MFVLKCLLFFGTVIAFALCNNTTPTTTVGLKEEYAKLKQKYSYLEYMNCVIEVEVQVGNPNIHAMTFYRNVNHTNKMALVALSNAASVTTITTPTDVQSVTPSNNSNIVRFGTSSVGQGKRRSVIIINSPSILRQSSKKRKRRGKKKHTDPAMAPVESLLYEEYDADGSKLVEFMMYTMEDVSKFFGSYLHTEICHVRCEPRPEDIAREEAKKKAAATTKKP